MLMRDRVRSVAPVRAWLLRHGMHVRCGAPQILRADLAEQWGSGALQQAEALLSRFRDLGRAQGARLAVLARPALLLFVGLLIAGMAYRRHRRWASVAMLGAFLLCLAPWAARNWAIHHQFVLVSTNGGLNFWIGNNPLATGEACDATGEPVWTRIPEPLKQQLAAQNEVQQDQFLYREGLRFIRDEPGASSPSPPAWWCCSSRSRNRSTRMRGSRPLSTTASGCPRTRWTSTPRSGSTAGSP